MPDFLFHGGPIYTLEQGRPRVEALLVRGDRIVARGTEQEIRPLLEDGYEDVPLDGRAVIPGLIDAHIHLLWTGLGRLSVDLDGVADFQDALERIRRHADRLPPGAWVRGH